MHYPDFFRRPGGPFTAEVLAAAGRHASEARPNEACGIVRAGVYHPAKNIAADPSGAFEVDRVMLAEAYKAGDLEGIIHSHPGGPWHPSKADMESQLETGVPWAILVPGDEGAQLACWWGAPRPPVFVGDLHVPRAFEHGVSDCYSLCQDYFREIRGVSLPDFPREWEWWKDPDRFGSLYLDNLARAGFEVISTDPDAFGRLARTGDAYLMCIRSKVPNHAGIYLGEGLLLEHMHGELSHRQPIARKLRHITHWLRLKD